MLNSLKLALAQKFDRSTDDAAFQKLWVAAYLLFCYPLLQLDWRKQKNPFLLPTDWASKVDPFLTSVQWSKIKTVFLSETQLSRLCSDTHRVSELQFNSAMNFWNQIEEDQLLVETLTNFSFKTWDQRTQKSLLLWWSNDYRLVPFDRSLMPTELLQLQIEGKRCISTLTETLNFKVGHRNIFEFCLHDLEHAEKFFNPLSHDEQRLSSTFLLDLMRNPSIKVLREDPLFAADFDYLAADMNTPWIHVWSCFSAKSREAFKRRIKINSNDRLPENIESDFQDFLRPLQSQARQMGLWDKSSHFS